VLETRHLSLINVNRIIEVQEQQHARVGSSKVSRPAQATVRVDGSQNVATSVVPANKTVLVNNPVSGFRFKPL